MRTCALGQARFALMPATLYAARQWRGLWVGECGWVDGWGAPLTCRTPTCVQLKCAISRGSTLVVMASLGNVRPKKGYSLMSESDGEDDQYEHCGILSSLPCCASGFDEAERAAPTSADAPSPSIWR